MRASSWSLAAIEPGNRWMAGVVAARAANSSGSAAAIAAGSKRAEPVGHLGRAAERVLHRVLLVEHHPRQQRERGLVEDLVGGGVAGDLDGHAAILPDGART